MKINPHAACVRFLCSMIVAAALSSCGENNENKPTVSSANPASSSPTQAAAPQANPPGRKSADAGEATAETPPEKPKPKPQIPPDMLRRHLLAIKIASLYNAAVSSGNEEIAEVTDTIQAIGLLMEGVQGTGFLEKQITRIDEELSAEQIEEVLPLLTLGDGIMAHDPSEADEWIKENGPLNP